MPQKKPKTQKGKHKVVQRVMREFHGGKLRSGSKSGPKVTDPAQAKAIAMSESGQARKRRKRLEGKAV